MIDENQEVSEDTQNDAGEVETEEAEVVSIPKKDYEKLNQTIGSLKREVKDLKKPRDPQETSVTNTKKSDDVDYGELAYHNTKTGVARIVHDDDVDYLREQIKETGKSMREILGSKFFQAELKDRQEARSAVQATPTSTRRTGDQSNALEIAYTKYLQTGQLPQDPILRRQVVNARVEHERLATTFSPNPIVEG